MSAVHLTVVSIKCDRCGEIFEDTEEESLTTLTEVSRARREAYYCGWRSEHDRDVCPDCLDGAT